MEKIEEKLIDGTCVKTYLNSENLNVTDVVRSLLENDVAISRIIVDENGEEHMREYRGDAYSSKDFLEKYDYIRRFGMALEYEICAFCDNDSMNIYMGEDSNRVVLASEDPLLDINDITQKKSERLGR